MKKLLFLLAISIFCNCNNQKTTPLYYTVDGNKVVFLDSYYTNYLKAVRADYQNHDKYYSEKIYEPITNLFSTSEYSELVKLQLYPPIDDTTRAFDDISFINNNRTKIKDLVSATLKDCNKYLKNDSLTIYILPTSNYNKELIDKMEDIMGLTAGSKQILIFLDKNINLSNYVFKFCLAHEFNHSYWTQKNYKTSAHFNLLDYLVFEGRADSYAHFLYQNKFAPWDTSLSLTTKTDLWNRIKSNLNSEDGTIMYNVMFGSLSNPQAYPLWGGYNLGYAIVQSALKNHPELTPEQWTNLPAEEILKMSDYNL